MAVLCMSHSSNTSNSLLVIFVLYYCVAVIVGWTKADLISDVCSQTSLDHQYCEQTLRSDPRSGNADLTTLAQIAIDSAQSNTKSTVNLVQSLKQNASDPRTKNIYDSCLENYNDTVDNLSDCNDSLKKKDYQGVALRASAALDGPDTCDDNFAEPPAPSEPRDLKTASNHVQELCSAILVVANKLQGNAV